MRSSRSDNGSFASAPTAAADAAATQVVLAFDDNRFASLLFGQYGQNLALIERSKVRLLSPYEVAIYRSLA